MPTYSFTQPSGKTFQYIADTPEEALKGARLMNPEAQPIGTPTGTQPTTEITAPLGSQERTEQLLKRSREMLAELSPVGEMIKNKLQEGIPKTENSFDLAKELAKSADSVINEETKNYILKQPDWQNLFAEALKAGGMEEVKSEVKDIQAEIDKILAQYDEDISKIQENPFMSDTTKRRNIARLKAITQSDLQPLLSQYENLKDKTAEIVKGAERTLGFMEKSYQYAATEQERMRQEAARIRDDARSLIQQYINTGAIGEFSDEQLKDIADWGIGYDYGSLAKLRSAVKQGSDLKIAKALSDLENQAERLKISKEQLDLARERLALAQRRGVGNESISDIRAENYDKVKQEAVQLFEADKIRNADRKVNPELYGEIRMRIPASLRDDFDKWAVDAGYLSQETKNRFGITYKGKEEILPPPNYIDIANKYREAGWTREQIEEVYKNSGKEIPESFNKALDEVFGSRSWWQKIKFW